MERLDRQCGFPSTSPLPRIPRSLADERERGDEDEAVRKAKHDHEQEHLEEHAEALRLRGRERLMPIHFRSLLHRTPTDSMTRTRWSE